MTAIFRWLELKNGPRCLIATCPIVEQDPKDLILIDWDEIKTFKTQKRFNDHLSARWLLQAAVQEWGGIDVTQLCISRTDERAPYLHPIQGLWIQPKLPNISISHSGNLACVALIESGWTVGIDAEPLSRPPNPSVFDMMAKGAELERLRSGRLDALEAWTTKEAIQKAARLGMHLNPRNVVLPEGESDNKITIEDSIFQLVNLSNDEYFIALAWGRDTKPIRSSEDDLLDATLEAMSTNDDWTVGCSTIRKNA